MNRLVINIIILIQFATDLCRYKVNCEQQAKFYRPYDYRIEHEYYNHEKVIQKYFGARKQWKTSNLGTMLFKNVDLSLFSNLVKPKTFLVYIWNHWSILYTEADLESSFDPLDGCSVRNCIFTRDKTFQDKADAILSNVNRGQYPDIRNRNPRQKWVLMTMESPNNTFSGYKYDLKLRLKDFSDKFNWIMSYRTDSDVPIPFGRVVPLKVPKIINLDDANHALSELVPFWELKQNTILIASMISNCSFRKRVYFAQNLRDYMRVDMYGDCAFEKDLKKSCPGYVREACSVLPHYFFYLALENSSCRQYLTEKIFFNAFANGAIPVIWGAPLEDCQKLLPPRSYIHVRYFNSYEHLSNYLIETSKNKTELLNYHIWRKHFKIKQDHGFFGTTPMQFCRLCEALNYNDDNEHVYSYNEMKMFLDSKLTCSGM